MYLFREAGRNIIEGGELMRKLDAKIAEALGWQGIPDTLVYDSCGEKYNGIPPGLTGYRAVPRYSTDGNAMLELDKEMRERGYGAELSFYGDSEYVCNFAHQEMDKPRCNYWATADTMPKAVALAAHKALTGRDWVG